MKDAVVIGAGVIGSAIAAHLRPSWNVTVASHFHIELADFDSIERFFQDRKVDLLVCAAGSYGAIGTIKDVRPQDWVRGLNVNLFGVYACCHFALQRIPVGGHIINIAGGGATTPVSHLSSYGCAKAALVRLTETIALECPWINVNAISPGPIASKMQQKLLAAGKSNPWYDTISRLCKGEGGVPVEKTLAVIDYILQTCPSGRLFFARTFAEEKAAA